jgi:hypothetical protein
MEEKDAGCEMFANGLSVLQVSVHGVKNQGMVA